MTRIFNFGAGPAMLPTEVMEKAQAEFIDYIALILIWHGPCLYSYLQLIEIKKAVIMKSILPSLSAALFAITLSQSAIADIDPDASTAAHRLEQATAFANAYVNFHYQEDYDSDAMKIEAEKLHDVLHEWNSGNATETEVAEQMQATKIAWNTFRQTINSSGILNSGDFQCDLLYQTLKTSFKNVRFMLNNVH